MEKIDFVMLWVDNNDPEWQNEYFKYKPQPNKEKGDASVVRYRDWENLKYWFRGVEKFAPWVNNIYFITCGHLPAWLNTQAPKLKHIRHADYIPGQDLPTFSANPIEINLHRIPELSERFVFFNDDIFITHPVAPERFFQQGLPCDMAVCNAISPIDPFMPHILANDVYCINSVFDKKEMIRQHPGKWLNLKYGGKFLRTLLLLPWPNFTGFFDPHLPNAFLKSTLEEVWGRFEPTLRQTSSCRFRSATDVNQYLFRYWQLVTGRFTPYNVCKQSRYIAVSDDNLDEVVQCIYSKDYHLLVLNDSEHIKDFETAKRTINQALETILPEKSSFEL